MSDYDFAFYLAEQDEMKRFGIKIDIETALSLFLKTDSIDTVIINDSEMPELKFDIINVKLIYEKEPYRVMIEPQIMNEFFDFRETLRKYNLTKG